MTAATLPAGSVVRCPACGSQARIPRCSCGAYVVPLGALDTVLTMNAERQAKHWRARSNIVKTWRDGTNVLCKALKIPKMEKATIYVVWNPRDNRRRDSGNLYPTAKAIVDGVVDAGVIPDDDAIHCIGPLMSIGPIVKPRATITLAIVEATP